ncbi:hypothetical protein TNCV_3585761 [Trichonephila clavipes]|nr:hypothetical protein TNCV_3585761 [Trichonephila clavipes]
MVRRDVSGHGSVEFGGIPIEILWDSMGQKVTTQPIPRNLLKLRARVQSLQELQQNISDEIAAIPLVQVLFAFCNLLTMALWYQEMTSGPYQYLLLAAPIMAGKDILEFVQGSKNIIDADSDDEDEMNNAASDTTSSEMRNIIKTSDIKVSENASTGHVLVHLTYPVEVLMHVKSIGAQCLYIGVVRKFEEWSTISGIFLDT